MAEPTRPDPDALLRHVQAGEDRDRRAKLKVFFGFAPGVGKTFRMLQVAREQALLGRDVLIGLVETHGRRDTAALLEGQAVLPRRVHDHHGRQVEELDLDAALARRPALLVVDELAHSNVAGARHGKRWQDVQELLDAGIDVFTTLNVQHIESLNDVIAQITAVQVRETVPDSVLDRADELELVDISPEQLLQRLKEGKVYLPEQAARAASHFFRRGNLLALRELALRRTAEHVDQIVQEYRARENVATTWPTSERVLVCVGPSPASAKLVRAARRMAAGLRAPWVAVYVADTRRPPPREADAARLELHLRLAESLGAQVVRLSGMGVAEPLLAYARKHNVTRIVVGKPTHARLRDRLRGSLLDDVVRASGEIDVYVISGDSPPVETVRHAGDERASFVLRPYLLATLLVALTTVVARLLRQTFAVPDLEMLYLLAVMVSALRFGRGPSMLAAAFSVAAYDLFFVPPYFTFAVRDGRYLLSFLMMFLVGAFLSTLTTRLKRQEHEARTREERAIALYGLSRNLGALLDPTLAADVVVRHAADGFGMGAAVLTPDASGQLHTIAVYPPDVELGATEIGVARWVWEHGHLAGHGTDTLPGARALCAALRVGPAPLGVLALLPHEQTPLSGDARSFLEAFCQQAAFAFERARLSEHARTAALRAKTEEMRSSLLSAVSHDLRTPLASITGAATTLRDATPVLPEVRAELLETICEEAERLERLVANLLDMTRLETGGLAPRREWVPLEELVGAALTRLEAKLARRRVSIAIPDLLLLAVDPVLMQQVFVNLFENAAKYSLEGSALDVRATCTADVVEIALCDHGPGIPPGATERIFEKFYRGAHVGVSGAGLGLAISRAIIEAHGGTLRAHNRSAGGACFTIRLPAPVGEPAAENRDES